MKRVRRKFFKSKKSPEIAAVEGTTLNSSTSTPHYPPVIEIFAFNSLEVVEKKNSSIDEMKELRDRFPLTWLNIDGLEDEKLVQAIGELFGLHKLALEDVINGHQRAKIEDYGDHLFIVTRMLNLSENGLDTEQCSMFLGKNFVITFQEKPGDSLNGVRERIRSNRGRIRSCGADYLGYSLLDAMIDGYFPVLERFGEELDCLEDEIIASHKPDTISRIHAMKKDLLVLRRAVWPLREVVNSLIRDPMHLVNDETRLYFRDCYDHSVRIIEHVESYRELAADLMSLYLSMVSNKMNEIMKVLTVISTIFIPLTFIAGVYGMNFKYMPELEWEYGYLFSWIVMLSVASVLIFAFYQRGWFGSIYGSDKKR